MKTKNNVQKTILRTGAVIMSFVLLSFTVAAQGYWKKLLSNNSLTLIASTLVDHKAEAYNPSSVSFDNAEIADETMYEAPLQFEPWMANFSLVGTDAKIEELATEQQITVKPWMVKSEFFNTGNIAIEQPLGMEDWMVSGKFWN